MATYHITTEKPDNCFRCEGLVPLRKTKNDYGDGELEWVCTFWWGEGGRRRPPDDCHKKIPDWCPLIPIEWLFKLSKEDLMAIRDEEKLNCADCPASVITNWDEMRCRVNEVLSVDQYYFNRERPANCPILPKKEEDVIVLQEEESKV